MKPWTFAEYRARPACSFPESALIPMNKKETMHGADRGLFNVAHRLQPLVAVLKIMRFGDRAAEHSMYETTTLSKMKHLQRHTNS
jgi:hypothetical protein